MSSELINAEKHLKDSEQKFGRKPESQIADVRKAVEQVIKHLKKLELEKDASRENVAGPKD
jgi:hypothetical protein